MHMGTKLEEKSKVTIMHSKAYLCFSISKLGGMQGGSDCDGGGDVGDGGDIGGGVGWKLK